MIRASRPRNRENRQTICAIATAREPVLDALRLVHEEYVRSGLTLDNRTGIRVTQYHLLTTTEILVGIVGDEVACTMSLVRDSRFGLPMEAIYAPEVRERRRMGKHLAEVSCLADRRDNAERTLNLMFRMIALAAQVSRARGVDEVLIAVHPRHSRFYERFFGFRGIGDLKYYGTVCGNPAVAMALDLVNVKNTNPKAYDRLYGVQFDQEAVRPRSFDLNVLEELSDIYLEEAETSRSLLNPDRVMEDTESEVTALSTKLAVA